MNAPDVLRPPSRVHLDRPSRRRLQRAWIPFSTLSSRGRRRRGHRRSLRPAITQETVIARCARISEKKNSGPAVAAVTSTGIRLAAAMAFRVSAAETLIIATGSYIIPYNATLFRLRSTRSQTFNRSAVVRIPRARAHTRTQSVLCAVYNNSCTRKKQYNIILLCQCTHIHTNTHARFCGNCSSLNQ